VSYDIVTVGEAMLRLWVPPGERLEDTSAFRVTVAGAEANVAIAAARMGHSVAWISRLPNSPLGRRAAQEIRAHGVDVSHVRWSDEHRMGTYYVELAAPPRPSNVIYDRADSAASHMTAADLVWDVIDSARIVHLSGITPALSDECRAISSEVARRASSLCLDVNYRSKLWSPAEARPVLEDLCGQAEVIILTQEDARDVFGLDGDARGVLEELRGLTGATSLVLTRGAAGAAWMSNDELGEAPGYDVEEIDRIGAGDAFAAGVLGGVLAGDLGVGVERGLAMAALKLGMYGDQLRPDPDEVERLLSEPRREIAR
jgi:2-dehydro-3-deoxygluconokinase